jgi:transposase
MMGKQETQIPLFTPGFDLAARVRHDHPLRRVKEMVDFSFVRAEVAHLYGYNGNVSVDPEVVLKMMFLLFFDDVASERLLMRVIPERLDYLWFLGYTLEDDIPDHSVLSKARARWGSEVFESFFVRTVAQCVAFGLVDGSKVHVDSTLVDADASTDAVVKGPPALMAALRHLYESQEAKLADLIETPDEEGDEPSWPPSVEDDEPGPSAETSRYEAVNDGLVSTTDPDARSVRQGKGAARWRHKNHRAVDNAFGVITATTSTGGDVTDNAELLGLLDQHEAHTGSKAQTAVADSKYGTADNFRACKQRGMHTHMADLAATHEGTGRRKSIYPQSAFRYDPETDTYTCPAGQTLRHRRHKRQRRLHEYTAGKKTCQACPLRAECTRSKAARILTRYEQHELVEAGRADSRTRAAKQGRRRRKHLMEGSFAEGANRHGLKRSRWRRLWRQRIQDLLIAACQNIRIALRHGPQRGRGVLHGDCGHPGSLVMSLVLSACTRLLALGHPVFPLALIRAVRLP